MRGRVLLTILFAAVGVARGNLITNGSFEQSCLTTHTNLYVAMAPGSSCITGWTVLDDSVHYIDQGGWQAADGVRSLDLDGPPSTAGAVSAPFATLTGHEYLLTFDMAGNPAAPPETKSMQVTVAGHTAVFTFDIGSGLAAQSLENMGWVQKQMTFTATSNSTTVKFKSIPKPGVEAGWGPALDNVVVTDSTVDVASTPEPASFGLVAGALFAFAAARFRRRP